MSPWRTCSVNWTLDSDGDAAERLRALADLYPALRQAIPGFLRALRQDPNVLLGEVVAVNVLACRFTLDSVAGTPAGLVLVLIVRRDQQANRLTLVDAYLGEPL